MRRSSDGEWQYDRRASSGGGMIQTFTGPFWPHGGTPGDVRYARCSPATGWRIFVVEPLGSGNLHDVPFATVLEHLPDALGARLRKAQADLVDECGRIASVWIDRRARYRRELLSVAGGTA